MARSEGEVQHYRILTAITNIDHPTQRVLARELGLSEPTIRSSLRWLEGRSLIERDETMKPHVLWRLTEKGNRELNLTRHLGEATKFGSR